MEGVDFVDIDSNGTFKYILIKLTNRKSEGSASKGSKLIVRGYSWAGYHADIFEEVEPGFTALDLKAECIGGGRIYHDDKAKTIKVYGYSMGFGQADHSQTCTILSKKYSNYPKNNITWTNDGY